MSIANANLNRTRLLNCHKWKYLIKCNKKESNQFKRNIVKSFYLIIKKLRILEKSSSVVKILGHHWQPDGSRLSLEKKYLWWTKNIFWAKSHKQRQFHMNEFKWTWNNWRLKVVRESCKQLRSKISLCWNDCAKIKFFGVQNYSGNVIKEKLAKLNNFYHEILEESEMNTIYTKPNSFIDFNRA